MQAALPTRGSDGIAKAGKDKPAGRRGGLSLPAIAVKVSRASGDRPHDSVHVLYRGCPESVR